MSRHSHGEIERIKRIAAKMTPYSPAQGSLAGANGSAHRWKPMDVAFGDNLHRPRRMILEAYPPTGTGMFDKWWRYTTCSESDGVGSLAEHSLRTKEEWLEWVERFSDDLTGRELRAVKDAARADFVEPDSWRSFRERFAATGDPWLRETPNDQA
jgi:hypothetical protein